MCGIEREAKKKCWISNFSLTFYLYRRPSRIILVSEHFLPQLPLNFLDFACWVAELKTALDLVTRTRKWKYSMWNIQFEVNVVIRFWNGETQSWNENSKMGRKWSQLPERRNGNITFQRVGIEPLGLSWASFGLLAFYYFLATPSRLCPCSPQKFY